MKKIKCVKSQEELENYIVFLSEDLKRRAKDIACDWNKSTKFIEIKTTIELGDILQWEIKKTYNAYEEVDLKCLE